MSARTLPSPAERPAEPEAPVTSAQGWKRHPPGPELWMGVGILAFYLVVALSALVVFRSSLTTLVSNPAWVRPIVLGPNWNEPFGVMPGFGINILTGLWQATPWDLAIVVSILAIDTSLGALLGSYAGANEGGRVDMVLTFVCDSLGSIPSVFLVVVVFAGAALVAPPRDTLLIFVVLFGVVLWPTTARTVREKARIVVHEPYVESARAAGAGSRHVLLRHVLPNSLEPILAQIPIDVIAVFFVLTVFPWFAAYTAPPPPPPPQVPPLYYVPVLPAFSPLPSPVFPEWGYLLGIGSFQAFTFPSGPIYWWMFLFPLVAIVGFGLGVAFLCDGLARWLRFGL